MMGTLCREAQSALSMSSRFENSCPVGNHLLRSIGRIVENLSLVNFRHLSWPISFIATPGARPWDPELLDQIAACWHAWIRFGNDGGFARRFAWRDFLAAKKEKPFPRRKVGVPKPEIRLGGGIVLRKQGYLPRHLAR